MAVPTALDVILQLTAGLGTFGSSENIALNYNSSDTANRLLRIPYEIAASGTDTSVNLGTYLDSLKFVIVVDKSNIGVKVGKASGAGKFTVGANKFMVITETSTFTVYLDNPDGSNATYGEIIAIGSSA